MTSSTASPFAEGIEDVPPSFIREILKVTKQNDVISFAGGLPNEHLFPTEQIKKASQQAFVNNGSQLLQYSNTEGDQQS